MTLRSMPLMHQVSYIFQHYLFIYISHNIVLTIDKSYLLYFRDGMNIETSNINFCFI